MADTPISLTSRQHYDRLSTTLLTDRSSFDAHWRDLADYFFPRRPRFFVQDRNRGGVRSQKIIDSTPVYAARTLQSGLHAGLTSPARPWMKLTTPNVQQANVASVKRWLHEVTQLMLSVFLKSNLYNVLPVLYGDLGIFGTAALGILEDDKDLMRGFVYPIGSYALANDARGLPNTFVREYEVTVGQLVEQFGHPDGGEAIKWSVFSDYIKRRYEEGHTEQAVWIVWMVVPNRLPLAEQGLKPWPFLSVHFEKSRGTEAGGLTDDSTNDKMLRESGFWEFPVLVPRWGVTGEDTYGTDCPGMIALGDAKGLQTLQKKKAQGVEKMINPPLVGPMQLKSQKTSLLPGDITYLDDRGAASGGLRPIHDTTLSINELLEDIGAHSFRIDRAFFADLFLMLARSDFRGAQPPTAREIEERHEEKLLALGPVLERTNDELLDPLVDRVFAMMERAGMLPPAPPELEGVDLKVEYISILGQAQKIAGVALNDRFFQSVSGLAQLFPQVRFKVDHMEAIDDYAALIGVNPALVRSEADTQALVDEEKAAVQQAREAEQSNLAAQSTKALADANLEGDSALTRLAQGQ